MKLRLLLLVLALVPPAALAQSASRADKWEFYFSPLFSQGRSYSFEGGASAKTDTGYGLVCGFAKNFSAHTALGADLGWTRQDYRATVTPGAGTGQAPVDIRGTLETATLRFHGTWYITPGQLAPFL